MTETEPMTLRPVGRCSRCRSLLLAKGTWTSIPKNDRRRLTGLFARHQGRRLCSACWERASKAGALIDHERVHLAAADRADDYQTMRDDLPTGASAHARAIAAAERMRCHPDTVKLALRRQGIAP